MEVKRDDNGDLVFTQEIGYVTIGLTNNFAVGEPHPINTNSQNELFVDVLENKRSIYFSMSLNQLRELVAAGELIIKARKDGEWPDVV